MRLFSVPAYLDCIGISFFCHGPTQTDKDKSLAKEKWITVCVCQCGSVANLIGKISVGTIEVSEYE